MNNTTEYFINNYILGTQFERDGDKAWLKGMRGEYLFERYFEDRKPIRNMNYKEYDFDMVDEDGLFVNSYEVKSKYADIKFNIEAWSDNEKTERSGWYKSVEAGILDKICFVNFPTRKIIVFNAADIYSFVNNNECVLRQATGGTNYKPGWIAFLDKENIQHQEYDIPKELIDEVNEITDFDKVNKYIVQRAAGKLKNTPGITYKPVSKPSFDAFKSSR